MELVIVIVAVVLGLAAGIGGAVYVLRSGQRSLGAERAELEAQQAAVLTDAVQALEARSQAAVAQAVQQAVDTAVTVAADRLGTHTQATSKELDLRSTAMADQVTQQMQSMQQHLGEVTRLVGELNSNRAKHHGELIAQLEAQGRQSAELQATTQQLREALANSRARGQWGERMAHDVLRSAGFVEGVNYRTQQTLPGGSQPDITIYLPQDRVLHVDVKFPFDNYLRVLESESESAVAVATKAFLGDVRARVKELTGRDYTDPTTTVGYVLLFIPNEAVYAFVHENDPGLFGAAQRQNVVLCSPSTLIAMLGVIRQAIDTYQLSRTSDEILALLSGFTKQWDSFSGKLDQLGKQLGTVHKSYEELAGTRRRQLEKQLDQIEVLRSARGVEPVLEAGAFLLPSVGTDESDHEVLDVVVDLEVGGPAEAAELLGAADAIEQLAPAAGGTLPPVRRIRPLGR